MVLEPATEVRKRSHREHAVVIEAARRAASRAHDELGATAVYLFGSRARGDWLMGSDCDLLVVSARFAGHSPEDRWNMVFDLWDGPVDVGPVGVTPEEFERGRSQAGLVAIAMADGAQNLLD